MDGNKILARLKTLKDVKSIKDIKPLTHYLFPGAHCPLMGVALAVRGIKDALLMVVGTDECTYYTKSFTMSKEFGGLHGRSVSVVLNSHDVTFGSVPKIRKAFDEMIKEYNPSCVFIVSTCVVEIIGDDIDSVADEMTELYNIPTMAVHTEHFKCQDHIPGVERTITACFNMMQQQEVGSKVNILGQRLGDFYSTELHTILKNNNIEIGLMLPSDCSSESIKVAPKAKLNIVVNDTALPLAEKMKKKFGTPYVLFKKFSNPENIYEAYKILFEILNLDFPTELLDKYNDLQNKILEIKSLTKGIKYIYGGGPLVLHEFNLFLAQLGLEPLLIQTERFDKKDKIYTDELCKLFNPYLSKASNIAALNYLYDTLKPDLYIGYEDPIRLKEKKITLVKTDRTHFMLGFEICYLVLENLSESIKSSYILKNNKEEI